MAKKVGFLLFVLVVLVSLVGPASAAPNISVTVRAANEGRIRMGGWATILVDLVNAGSDVSLELTATQKDGPMQGRVEYVVPVTLAAGGKKRVSVDLPTYNSNTIAITLRSGATVIHSETLTLNMVPPNQMLIGVLSDDELGVPALSRMGPSVAAGSVTPQVVRLDATSFPTQAALLADFDLLALSHFDTATLSPEQIKALEAWVGRGGKLLLAGGPEWKRTFSGLPASLLPVQVTGAGDADLTPLGQLAGKPITGKGPVSQAKLLHGHAEATQGDVPLLVQAQVGKGSVLYLAADPGLEPMIRWDGQAALFERYLYALPKMAQMERFNTANYMQGALSRIPGLGLPSIGLLALLVLLYILLAGPVNYWVLKRLDRREWSWFTVPVLAALVVAGVYVVGVGRRTSIFSNLITITQLAPGTEMASVRSYVGLFAPAVTRMEVGLENAGLVEGMLNNYNPNGGTTRVVLGEKSTVQFGDMNNYSMRGFSTEQDLLIHGNLELAEASLDDSGALTAKLVNRLDLPLTDVRVIVAGNVEEIGSLAPGAASDRFSIAMNATNPNDVKRRYMGMTEIIPYRNDPVLDTERQVLGAVFGAGPASMGQGIIVTGWTAEPLAAPELPDLGRLSHGANLVYTTVPLPAETADGSLPPGVIQGVPVDFNNMGQSPFGYMLGPGTHTFRLTLPHLDLTRVADVKLHLGVVNGLPPFTVAVKNPNSGQWVTVKSDPVQSLANWQELISATGTLELRIDCGQASVEMAPPTISIKGVSR